MKKQIYMIALSGLFLSACQHVENFDAVHVQPEPVVNKVETSLNVSFDYGSSHLTAEERQRIDHFVMAHDISRMDDLEIKMTQAGGVLAKERAETIAAYFKHLGVPSYFKWHRHDEALQSIEVTVAKYTVSVPNCPDWSANPSHNFNNQPHSNFGCAQAANLALMIGDPRDLVRGRDLTPADSRVLHNAIDLYRNPTRVTHDDIHTVQDSSGGE